MVLSVPPENRSKWRKWKSTNMTKWNKKYYILLCIINIAQYWRKKKKKKTLWTFLVLSQKSAYFFIWYIITYDNNVQEESEPVSGSSVWFAQILYMDTAEKYYYCPTRIFRNQLKLRFSWTSAVSKKNSEQFFRSKEKHLQKKNC